MAIAVSQRSAIGSSVLANARHFRVSPRFVNDMVILKRDTGGLGPKPQGKLAPFSGWLRDRLAVKGDLTLDKIVAGMPACMA